MLQSDPIIYCKPQPLSSIEPRFNASSSHPGSSRSFNLKCETILSSLPVHLIHIMPPIPPLFTLPIEPSGSITCAQPSPKVYLLAFSSPPDNRLTVSFCNAFHLALDIIAHRYPKGVVVSTSRIAKFYSNGLDYETAIKTKGFLRDNLYPLWKRLLTCVSPRTPSGLT